MTHNSDHDSADENDGKYSSDERMTFDSLLKSSLRERQENREILDELVEKDRGQTPPERNAENQREKRREEAEREREEFASRKRKLLAERLAEVHVSDSPVRRIASGETSRIGHYTNYEFARTTVDEEEYYYIVQTTDRSYAQHWGELVVKDLGTSWSYNLPEIDEGMLKHVLGQQRQSDFRENREPVSWLTADQFEAVARWYRKQVERTLSLVEELPRQREDSVHLVGEYLVVDQNRPVVEYGLSRSLSERQVQVVLESLVPIVRASTEMPQTLYEHIDESVDYPLLAELTFDSE